jgi:hypothetical protein
MKWRLTARRMKMADLNDSYSQEDDNGGWHDIDEASTSIYKRYQSLFVKKIQQTKL